MKRSCILYILLTLFLVLLLPLSLRFADAETVSGTCGENLTWTFDPDTGTLTIEGTGDMDSIISDAWQLDYTTQITSVNLPDGLTRIGDHAFEGCTGLSSVTIPSSVISIGFDAFQNSGLTSITIPDSVTSIESSAFFGCTALSSVELPSGITEISHSLFYNCTALTSVTIPDGVTVIGDNAFDGCEALSSITIPSSVTTIYDSAFCWCTALTLVTIPDSVTYIGAYTFAYCTNLTEAVISDSITYIGAKAFAGCTNLRVLTLPCSLTFCVKTDHGFYVSDDLVFENCTAIEQIHLTKGTGAIADFDQNTCTITPWNISRENTLTVTLDIGVETIGTYAFYGCTGLTNVVYNGTRVDAFLHLTINDKNEELQNAIWHYQVVYTDKCGDALIWRFNPDTGVLTIEGSGEMWDCGLVNEQYYHFWKLDFDEQIKAVIIGDHVTSIG